MLLFRRVLRPACRILVGTLLFAQAAFATRPCVEPGMSAATAIASQSDGGCCETAVAELNLCTLQCGDNKKLPGPAYLFTPPAPVAATVVVLPPLHDYGAMTWLRRQQDLVPDPPPTLRFCCFLI